MKRASFVPDSRTVNIDGVGNVLLARSRRARRITIYVRPSGEVKVSVPARASFNDAAEFAASRADWIRKHIARIRQMERLAQSLPTREIDVPHAKTMLTERLLCLAKRYGFDCGKVTVRNQKTRWGSCSHNHNISLNIKLALLPENLMDYVILHELVHTRVHNHSSKFWAELDRYVGNGKALSKELRRYGLSLM